VAEELWLGILGRIVVAVGFDVGVIDELLYDYVIARPMRQIMLPRPPPLFLPTTAPLESENELDVVSDEHRWAVNDWVREIAQVVDSENDMWVNMLSLGNEASILAPWLPTWQTWLGVHSRFASLMVLRRRNYWRCYHRFILTDLITLEWWTAIDFENPGWGYLQ